MHSLSLSSLLGANYSCRLINRESRFKFPSNEIQATYPRSRISTIHGCQIDRQTDRQFYYRNTALCRLLQSTVDASRCRGNAESTAQLYTVQGRPPPPPLSDRKQPSPKSHQPYEILTTHSLSFPRSPFSLPSFSSPSFSHSFLSTSSTI